MRHQRYLSLDVSKDEKRGMSFVGLMFLELLKTQPLLIPYAFLNSVAKYLGYFIGKHANKIPSAWWRPLSGQKYYWTSKAFLESPERAAQTIERIYKEDLLTS